MPLDTKKLPDTGGKKVEPIDAGTYPAIVAGLIDLGVQPQRPFKGQSKSPQHEIMITYELVTEFMKDEDGNELEDKPRHISERFPFHKLTAEMAKSTKRYKALDPHNKFEGDFSKLVGVPCSITVVQNYSQKTDRYYSNVSAVTPPMKGFQFPDLKNPPKVLDRDDPDMEVWEALPDFIKTIVTSGLDFSETKLAKMLEDKPPEPPKEKSSPAKKKKEDDDDEPPF